MKGSLAGIAAALMFVGVPIALLFSAAVSAQPKPDHPDNYYSPAYQDKTPLDYLRDDVRALEKRVKELENTAHAAGEKRTQANAESR